MPCRPDGAVQQPTSDEPSWAVPAAGEQPFPGLEQGDRLNTTGSLEPSLISTGWRRSGESVTVAIMDQTGRIGGICLYVSSFHTEFSVRFRVIMFNPTSCDCNTETAGG